MNRKLELVDIDIPKDDVECWERYPKYRWVYELSRLLDAQHIKWSPYETESLDVCVQNIVLETEQELKQHPGYIFTKKSLGNHVITEVYAVKGEIKLLRHISPKTGEAFDDIIGEIELRVNAFMTLHFQKFTGVMSIETYGVDIIRIRLKPYTHISLETDPYVIKLLKRIYKRTDSLVNGLTDQVTHELIAS